MYCILDTRNNTFTVGEFQTVINKVFKWRYTDGILVYKTRDFESETININTDLNWLTKDQLTTVICNYLWSNLDRFGYIRFRQV